MRYYYLAASLPALVLGDPVPVTWEKFRADSATVLNPEDLAEADRTAAGRLAEGTSAFAAAWTRTETQMRNAVARARAQRLGVDARPFLREHAGYDVSLEKEVTDAFAKPNPMERELALDRCRWHRLDDMARREPFELTAILAFVAKLRIASRWAAMSADAGRERVEAFVGAGLEREGTLLSKEQNTNG